MPTRLEKWKAEEAKWLRPHGPECEHCKDALKRDIASLCRFDEDQREEILWAREQDEPPPQWLYFLDGMARMQSRAYCEWRRRHPPKRRPYGGNVGALRWEVIERDGLVCGICGGSVEPNDVHIDHVLPYSLGGLTVLENLRVAHSRCNIRRGNRLDWRPS